MKHALSPLAILLLACASSAVAAPPAAAPSPPPAAPAPAAPAQPSPPATCHPAGPLLFEIDHRVDPGAKLATSSTKVFGNGAWTHDETDADAKPLPATAGCLARPEVKQLETALTGAPWKVTTSRMHCMAMSSTFTVYQVRGKPVFTQRLCSGESLDDKSRAALDAAIALVEGGARPAP